LDVVQIFIEQPLHSAFLGESFRNSGHDQVWHTYSCPNSYRLGKTVAGELLRSNDLEFWWEEKRRQKSGVSVPCRFLLHISQVQHCKRVNSSTK